MTKEGMKGGRNEEGRRKVSLMLLIAEWEKGVEVT